MDNRKSGAAGLKVGHTSGTSMTYVVISKMSDEIIMSIAYSQFYTCNDMVYIICLFLAVHCTKF